ncbi:hypothetical protein M427DRAFT_30783 [Gonapodya prolifera JEL478]|uniref:Uncharacterized protein n=1 Tax=Gonapodya prolifera (strain JEL478) TaxID=1344416 RepID=A0A139AKC1_GONPJ|nr:hypothetical protein M427DRAFT_30783 [Gonapodya prolifera JEL478]|eukprot:KXS16953.1 hypothetical protein M427DRAFT_30783 [Gonapodya prolifera JEL478]
MSPLGTSTLWCFQRSLWPTVLRNNSLAGPAGVVGCLATIRIFNAGVQNSLPGSDPPSSTLTTALYDAIALDLFLAFSVAFTSFLRLRALVMNGKTGHIVTARLKFATEVAVYAGGAFLSVSLDWRVCATQSASTYKVFDTKDTRARSALLVNEKA